MSNILQFKKVPVSFEEYLLITNSKLIENIKPNEFPPAEQKKDLTIQEKLDKIKELQDRIDFYLYEIQFFGRL